MYYDLASKKRFITKYAIMFTVGKCRPKFCHDNKGCWRNMDSLLDYHGNVAVTFDFCCRTIRVCTWDTKVYTVPLQATVQEILFHVFSILALSPDTTLNNCIYRAPIYNYKLLFYVKYLENGT